MQNLLERAIVWLAERLDANLIMVPEVEEP